MNLFCSECGKQMQVSADGVSSHAEDGVIDYNQDADHVAILDESENNYISIYGFVSKKDIATHNETHIDSVLEYGDWEQVVKDIICDKKGDYCHIIVESDNGKPLPSFES